MPRTKREPARKPPRRRLVTMAQIEADYGVAVRTQQDWIAEGRLPAYRLGPRMVRIDLDDLEALLRPITGTDPS